MPRPAPTFGEGQIRPTPNPRNLATYNQHHTAAIREIPIASFEAMKVIARLNFRCLFVLRRRAGLFSQTAAGNRAYSHWQSTHNTIWATPHDPWGCNEDVMREGAVTLSRALLLLVLLTLSSNLLDLLTRYHGWTTRINVIWSQVRQLRQRWNRNWSGRYMRNKGGVARYIRNNLTVVKCLLFNLTLNHLHKFASPNGTPLFSMRNLFPT